MENLLVKTQGEGAGAGAGEGLGRGVGGRGPNCTVYRLRSVLTSEFGGAHGHPCNCCLGDQHWGWLDLGEIQWLEEHDFGLQLWGGLLQRVNPRLHHRQGSRLEHLGHAVEVRSDSRPKKIDLEIGSEDISVPLGRGEGKKIAGGGLAVKGGNNRGAYSLATVMAAQPAVWSARVVTTPP